MLAAVELAQAPAFEFAGHRFAKEIPLRNARGIDDPAASKRELQHLLAEPPGKCGRSGDRASALDAFLVERGGETGTRQDHHRLAPPLVLDNPGFFDPGARVDALLPADRPADDALHRRPALVERIGKKEGRLVDAVIAA